MDRKPLSIAKAVILCLALAGVAAPTAAAEPRGLGDIDPMVAAAVQKAEHASVIPDDRTFNRGASSPSLSPDDRAFNRGASLPSLSPDDRALFRRVETLHAAPPVVHATSDSPTFQWNASVGVATTLGFVFLLAAGFLVARHQRRRLTF
jgi:hypothetical protein